LTFLWHDPAVSIYVYFAGATAVLRVNSTFDEVVMAVAQASNEKRKSHMKSGSVALMVDYAQISSWTVTDMPPVDGVPILDTSIGLF
jgi:hypothetical protein